MTKRTNQTGPCRVIEILWIHIIQMRACWTQCRTELHATFNDKKLFVLATHFIDEFISNQFWNLQFGNSWKAIRLLFFKWPSPSMPCWLLFKWGPVRYKRADYLISANLHLNSFRNNFWKKFQEKKWKMTKQIWTFIWISDWVKQVAASIAPPCGPKIETWIRSNSFQNWKKKVKLCFIQRPAPVKITRGSTVVWLP